MNQNELFNYLSSLQIKTITLQHEPLFTCQQAQVMHGTIAGGHCKNLFLKDDTRQLWLITALWDTKIDLKQLSKVFMAPKLRFADAHLLKAHLGLEPGSVTPFGIINDSGHTVRVILEKALFSHEVINVHPLTNDATTSLAPQDLEKFILSLGNSLQIIDFSY